MRLILGIVLLCFVLMPEVVSAQLVQCGGTYENPCDLCSLVSMVNRLVNFLITLMVMIAVILGVVAGFRLVVSRGNSEAMTKARNTLSNVAIGFIIVLSAWLIVDTILRLATKTDGLQAWGVVDCGGQVKPGLNLNASNTATEGPESGGAVLQDPDALRVVFTASGIPVNKGECPAGVSYKDVEGGCTSVAGLKAATRDTIIEFKSACGGESCEMVITGASELGHAGDREDHTHGGGDKFDLRTTATVNSFIRGSSFQTTNYRGRQGRLSSENGVFCVREGIGTKNDHWDCARVY